MAAMKKADRKSHGPFLLHRTPAAEGDKAAAPPPEDASVSAVRVAQTERFVDAIQVQYKNGEGDWHGSFESSGELSAWQTLACMGDELQPGLAGLFIDARKLGRRVAIL